MPSKEVIDREKSAHAVQAAAEAHAEAAAQRLADALSPHLARGERMPDVALLLRLLGRSVAATASALAETDAAHARELADDAAPRARRDAASATLYEVAYQTRDAVKAAHGEAGLAALAMEKPAPADPTALARWTQDAVARLRDSNTALPPALRRGLRIDRRALADELVAELPALVEALHDVERERREAESTLDAKGRATESHDATFSRVAGAITALFRAAGMEEIASKVRPSGRRPGRTAETDPEPAPTPDGPSQ